MIIVDIAIQDRKKPPTLKFPGRCINCGRPQETVMPLKLSMGVQKRQQMVMMDCPCHYAKPAGKKSAGSPA